MIIIRTVCDSCGEILVRSNDIHLHLSEDKSRDYFDFKCPRCGLAGSGEADEQFVRILIENGVKPDVQKEIQFVGGPLTWDDYLDFKLGLRKPLFYKELYGLSKHSS